LHQLQRVKDEGGRQAFGVLHHGNAPGFVVCHGAFETTALGNGDEVVGALTLRDPN
jgi:hypothetical protein